MVSGILQILTGEHAGRTFLLEGKMVVGRDAGSAIRINDRSISRKHAALEQRDDGFYVVDLGSQNGTLLNDAPVTESILPGACKLQFGTIQADVAIGSDVVRVNYYLHVIPYWSNFFNGHFNTNQPFLCINKTIFLDSCLNKYMWVNFS